MASTSQIANRLSSGSRKSTNILILLFIGGTMAITVPITMAVLKDKGQGLDFKFANILKPFSPQGAHAQIDKPAISENEQLVPAQARSTGNINTVALVAGAVDSLNQSIRKSPDNPVNYNRLGLLYAEMGQMNEAAQNFKKAIELSRINLQTLSKQLDDAKANANGPSATTNNIILSISQAEIELSAAHSNLARVFEKLGEQSRVVAQLNELNRDIVIGAGPMVARNEIATKVQSAKPNQQAIALLAQAKALMQVGRLPEATAHLRSIQAINPQLAEPHEELGKIGLMTNNSFMAIQELKNAALLNPTKASTHAQLGIVYQNRARTKEAIEEFKKALKLDGKDAVTAFNLGNAYFQLNQSQDAMMLFQRAVELNPQMAAAHNNIASIYANCGQTQEAIDKYEEALSLDPNLASAHYGLGLAYKKLNEKAQAISEFKKAIALNPALIDCHSQIDSLQKSQGPRAIKRIQVRTES